MAITFTLVTSGPSHAVYLADSEGTTQAFDTGVLQVGGAGDADVALEDAAVPPTGANWPAGLLKEVADVGAINTQAEARRKLLDWGGVGLPTASDGLLNVNGKRLRAYFVPVAPTGGEVLKSWAIDADTDASLTGEYNVTATATGSARALLVIEALGTPQQF